MIERVYLEFHDDKKNKHRFYQLFIMQGLLGEWSLVREWGRVGSSGTVKKDWFETEDEVLLAREEMRQLKIKKGYRKIL